MRRLVLACLLVATTTATAAVAQQPASYQRSVADTLRYREVSTGVLEVTTPQGTVAVSTFHDAQMAITFGDADTASAWYEALEISTTSPQGKNAPATEAALGQPFLLRFDARGRVATLQAPTFPSTFEGVSDLRHQFADYFLPLPAGALAIGTAWRDSTARADSTGPDKHSLMQRWTTYQVVRDTVVGGIPALVIEAQSRHRMRSVVPVPGMTATSELEGGDRGHFYWDAIHQRLLGRTRTGELTGTLQMSGAGAEVEFAQALRYENQLALLP